MNLLLLAAFGLGCLGLLWAAQALAMLASGERTILVLPYRHNSESPKVRYALKLALHVGLVSTICLYPWAIGLDPWQYHLERFTPASWGPILLGLMLAIGLLGIPLAINLAMGWVRFSCRYSTPRLIYKIAKSFLIPIPLTLVEEPLFRGIVQEQFLQTMPKPVAGQALAVICSSLLFAAVHFIRPQRQALLPAIGLFGLGVILSLAYIRTGHHYLLPIAIHAGGVWFIQVTRPIADYRGPTWLIGYSTYPICGGLGLSMMVLLGVLLMTAIGA